MKLFTFHKWLLIQILWFKDWMRLFAVRILLHPFPFFTKWRVKKIFNFRGRGRRETIFQFYHRVLKRRYQLENNWNFWGEQNETINENDLKYRRSGGGGEVNGVPHVCTLVGLTWYESWSLNIGFAAKCKRSSQSWILLTSICPSKRHFLR